MTQPSYVFCKVGRSDPNRICPWHNKSQKIDAPIKRSTGLASKNSGSARRISSGMLRLSISNDAFGTSAVMLGKTRQDNLALKEFILELIAISTRFVIRDSS